MEIVIVVGLILSSFALGRLTNFKADNKVEKIQHELDSMTESRDRWREQYLVRVMRDKLNELNCKNDEV